MDLVPKKGFIHLVPLVVIAVLVVGSISFLSNKSEQSQKDAVGEVLSSSDEGSGNSGKSSLGSSSGESNSGKSEDDRDKDSSGPGSADTLQVESKTGESRVKVKTKSDDEAKIEIRTGGSRFKTEVKNGEEKTEIRAGGLRFKWEKKDGEFILKVKNEEGEDVELGEDREDELLEDLEKELEEDDIEISTGSAQLGFVQNGRRVRTNFPLSVNPATGELFVTTPAGEKVVAILPDRAIQNMIRAGVLTRVDDGPLPEVSPTPEGTPSAEPDEGTSSASVDGANIELTEEDGEPIYVISGVRSQNFLGIVPVDVQVKAKVSAQTGSLLDIEQGFFSRLLDLLSF